jgi:hypothetical protein
MSGDYRGAGSAPYHPIGILVYGHAKGLFSDCKLERATRDSVAFRSLDAKSAG